MLYYQSPMHPWVKSDKPGKCTVCGMELVPVYEGAPNDQACNRHRHAAGQAAPNVASIKTAEVRRQPLARTLRVAGTIDDDESRHRILSAYTGGRIEKLFVNYEGAEVQARPAARDVLQQGSDRRDPRIQGRLSARARARC